MSRKQEIYREILARALPATRGALSKFHRVSYLRVLSRKKQEHLRNAYDIAEFVHNLYVSILEESFTSHDIWFLNHQARRYIELYDEKTCSYYPIFTYYIQELFEVVPDDLRNELEWSAPPGDYIVASDKNGSRS